MNQGNEMKLSLFFFISTLFLSNNLLYSATETVAEVNGSKISKDVFNASYKQNLLFVTNKKVTKEKVLNDLINRELGVQRARGNDLHKDPIVQKKMEDIMYHAQISKDLEPKLKKIKVKDNDVKDYYQKHPEFRTAHILFRVRAQPEVKETEAALKQALKIYQMAKKKPGKFPELANKYSQSSTAVNGGDLGFQPAIIMAPEYFEAIKGKSKGYITPPVRTQFGYHIIKVLSVKKFKDINLPRYKKLVYDQKRDKILEDYFKSLRDKANIKIIKSAL